MGTIQDSINTMLGTVAAGAAAAKHIKNQSEATEIAKENLQIEALENEPKLAEELDDLGGQEFGKEFEIG